MKALTLFSGRMDMQADSRSEMIIYVDGQEIEMDVVLYDPFPETDHIVDVNKMIKEEAK